MIEIDLLPPDSRPPPKKPSRRLASCLVLLLLLAVLAYAGWLGQREYFAREAGSVKPEPGESIDEPSAAAPETPPEQTLEKTVPPAESGDSGIADKAPDAEAGDDEATARREAAAPVAPEVPAAAGEPEPVDSEIAAVPDAAEEKVDADVMVPEVPAPVTDDDQAASRRFDQMTAELMAGLEKMRLAMEVGNYAAVDEIGVRTLEALTETGDRPVTMKSLADEIIWLRGVARQLLNKEAEAARDIPFDRLPIRVEGVIWSPEKKVVFVNGSVLSAGDAVPGLEVDRPPVVTEIAPGLARFHYRGETHERRIELFGEK